MDNHSFKNIQSSADFANVLQFKNEEERAAIYGHMKEQLPNLIHSSNDFANVLQYLNPSQQRAVFEQMKPKLLTLINSDEDRVFTLRYLSIKEQGAITNLLTFIDQMKASEPAKQFASALLEEDKNKMKSHFDDLLEQSPPVTKKNLSFFEQERPINPVVEATSRLGPQWISKISDALGLNLNEKNKASKEAIVNALKTYSPTTDEPRATK